MITKFKSKEQRENEIIEELREFYSEREFNRLKRIFKNEVEGTDRLFISNNVVKIKFELRKIYKELDYLYEKRRYTENILECDFDDETRKQLEEYIECIKEQVECLSSKISSYGTLLINTYIPFMDKYFNEHEIIQIIGGSYEQCKRIKKYYDKHNTGTRSLTDSFIVHHGEYRWRRGLSKEFINCPRWEMPLFECVSNYMLEAIRKNSKLRAESDKVFEDIFGEAMVYATTDSQGNIISVEKLYQDIAAKDLIKSFKGKFINDLKNDSSLNIAATYKVKLEQDGSYTIVDEDKKAIATIYKKTS